MNKSEKTRIKLNSVEFRFTKISYHTETNGNIGIEVFPLISFLVLEISERMYGMFSEEIPNNLSRKKNYGDPFSNMLIIAEFLSFSLFCLF